MAIGHDKRDLLRSVPRDETRLGNKNRDPTLNPRIRKMHSVMHMYRNCPHQAARMPKLLDVGGSCAALALVLRFDALIFVLPQHRFNN